MTVIIVRTQHCSKGSPHFAGDPHAGISPFDHNNRPAYKKKTPNGWNGAAAAVQPINSKYININSFISQNSTIHDSICNIAAVYCLLGVALAVALPGFHEMVFRNGYEYRTATTRPGTHVTSFKQINNALGGWSFFSPLFLRSTRWRKTQIYDLIPL